MAQIPLNTRFIGIAPDVALPENKTNILNNKTEPYTINDLQETIGVGAQGPQGIAGPPGPIGPVGPAGLTWKGQWVSGTEYFENDAVGYNGASWFLFTESNAGSENENPEDNTSHWALLAAQGAQGPQGPQGPQGAQGPQGVQGPAGTAPVGTSGLVTATASFPFPVLSNTINQVLAPTDNNLRVVLPTSSAVVGQRVIVSCVGGNKLLIKAAQVGGGIYTNGLNETSVDEFFIYPNETYEFVYNGSAEWISSFEKSNAGECVTKVLKTTITSSQVLNLFTNPVTILSNSNPFTISYPLNVYIKRNSGSPYTVPSNALYVINDVGNGLATLNANPLQSSGGFTQGTVTTNQISGGTEMSEYKLIAAGNPTGGTGSLDVYVTYVEFTL